MKSIMAKASSEFDHDVPNYDFAPAGPKQSELPFEGDPIAALSESLLEVFAWRKITMDELYEKHNVGTNYYRPNYVKALGKLEEENRITVMRPSKRSRKGTFSDKAVICFPQKKGK